MRVGVLSRGIREDVYCTLSLTKNIALTRYASKLNNCNLYMLNKFTLSQKKSQHPAGPVSTESNYSGLLSYRGHNVKNSIPLLTY